MCLHVRVKGKKDKNVCEKYQKYLHFKWKSVGFKSGQRRAGPSSNSLI